MSTLTLEKVAIEEVKAAIENGDIGCLQIPGMTSRDDADDDEHKNDTERE